MPKSRHTSGNPTKSLLSRLMIPDLHNLNTAELIDLFINTGKQFQDGILRNASIEDLDRLQVQIATIKDEIYKKSNLSPESSINNDFFYTSLMNRN